MKTIALHEVKIQIDGREFLACVELEAVFSAHRESFEHFGFCGSNEVTEVTGAEVTGAEVEFFTLFLYGSDDEIQDDATITKASKIIERMAAAGEFNQAF